ncbi:MAG: carotenoid biosynthesis protein [Gemmatimonadota bacterium]|jgi:putative membrane protein
MTPVAPSRTHERWALVVLLAFTLLSVGGYWNFALHPERIPTTPLAARFYAISFGFFARIHIVVAASALLVVLVGRLRARWVPALAAVYGLAFLAEHVGTGTGFPFGGYGYTALLGPKLGGRVPVLIPLSWFFMALPSWLIVRRALPGSRIGRVLLGALWLAAWDLALDPAMSYLTPYWRWEVTGAYYGMPWMNLPGWYATGLAIMLALDLLGPGLGLERLPTRWMGAYYGVVLLMPLGMVLAAGLWGAVLATAGGLAVCAALTVGAGRREARSAPGSVRTPTPDPAGRRIPVEVS